MGGDWEVVGEAADGEEALRMTRLLKPDAIIMDITMPLMSGIEAAARIVKQDPESKVLIFTMHDPCVVFRQVQHSGAKGVLTKSRAASELGTALATILAGQTYFHSYSLEDAARRRPQISLREKPASNAPRSRP
jgi:two-component system nitrate/nitrite response regulator NarL